MEQVAQLRDFAGRLASSNADLVLVGNGSLDQGRDFAERQELPFRLVVDPELTGYRAATLKRDLLYGVRPRTPLDFLRAWRSGFRGDRQMGDPYELGGVFVIAPGGEVRLGYVSRRLGDHPPVEEILAAL